MIFTRDEDWKEVTVGRVFKNSDYIDPNGELSCIRHSQYLSDLNNSQFFTGKMDDLIESYGRIGKRLVFISDGESRIRNWIEDAFPDAVSKPKTIQIVLIMPKYRYGTIEVVNG